MHRANSGDKRGHMERLAQQMWCAQDEVRGGCVPILMLFMTLLLCVACLLEPVPTPTPTPVETPTRWDKLEELQARVAALEATLPAAQATFIAARETLQVQLHDIDGALQTIEATVPGLYATAQAVATQCAIPPTPTATPTSAVCAPCVAEFAAGCPEGYWCKQCAPGAFRCVSYTSPSADCVKCLSR